MQDQYQIVQTLDGSMTLYAHFEAMHHNCGALSETLYVYEPVIKHIVEHDLPLHFLCIGLGMGYIEIMTCAFFTRYFPDKLIHLKFISFEPQKDLCQNFMNVILQKNMALVEHSNVYVDIMQRIADHYAVSYEVLSGNMKKLLLNSNLTIKSEPYTTKTKLECLISGVFFDPYSFKFCPEIWKEDLIQSILVQFYARCCFASYAARTDLKKLLKKHNFILAKKSGFAGKRECTFAYRG